MNINRKLGELNSSGLLWMTWSRTTLPKGRQSTKSWIVLAKWSSRFPGGSYDLGWWSLKNKSYPLARSCDPSTTFSGRLFMFLLSVTHFPALVHRTTLTFVTGFYPSTLTFFSLSMLLSSCSFSYIAYHNHSGSDAQFRCLILWSWWSYCPTINAASSLRPPCHR